MRHRTFAARLLSASVSPFGAFSLRFIRTLILSRLLIADEVGASVLLLSMLTACELVTDVGLGRFVMVANESDRAQAVAAARQISIVRGVILAILITYFAPELAALFGAPDLAGSAAWLGPVSLIYSLRNWRLDQIQREYRYGPETISTICAGCAAVLALVPGFLLWHDHRMIVLSLFSEAITYTVVSHILVRHEAVGRVDRAMRRAALAYSLPLMANGICLMLIKQLDQIVVSNFFGLATLATYALGFNLAVTPTSPIQAICQKIGIPALGNAVASPEKYRRTAAIIILASTLLAAGFAIPCGFALDYAVPLLYGQQYHLAAGFASFAMLSAYLRLCRGGPTMLLLQRGATGSLAVGNLAAGIGALVGLLAGVMFRQLDGVMAGFASGDLASFAVYLFLVRRQVPLGLTLKHCGFITVVMFFTATALWVLPPLALVQRTLTCLVCLGGIVIQAVLVWRSHGRQVVASPTRELSAAFPQVTDVA